MLNASGCEHFFKSAMTWEWVVLDEGHRIRNPGTNLCQLVHKIESRGRLILSGTPLQVHTPDHDYSLLFSPCGCTALLVGCCRTTWASCTSCSTTVRACTRVAAFFHLFLSHETHSAILCAVYEDHAIFTDKSKFEEAHSRGQGLNKSKLQLAHELLAMVYRYSRNAAVSTIVQAKHDAASA